MMKDGRESGRKRFSRYEYGQIKRNKSKIDDFEFVFEDIQLPMKSQVTTYFEDEFRQLREID